MNVLIWKGKNINVEENTIYNRTYFTNSNNDTNDNNNNNAIKKYKKK
jgi:hypothetical protein